LTLLRKDSDEAKAKEEAKAKQDARAAKKFVKNTTPKVELPPPRKESLLADNTE